MSQNRPCGSYRPGHAIHWIQAKKSHEPGPPIIRVKVAAVHDDGCIGIEGDDLNITLWHHDADRLRSALYGGASVEWMPKFHVLRVAAVSFNLATPDHVEPCVPPRPPRKMLTD